MPQPTLAPDPDTWQGAYVEFMEGPELEQGLKPYRVLDYFDVLYYLWNQWRSSYDMAATAKKDAVYLFYYPTTEKRYLQSMPNNPDDWGFEYKGTIGYFSLKRCRLGARFCINLCYNSIKTKLQESQKSLLPNPSLPHYI